MIEYDDNKDSHDGLVKWPFYLSALFIFALVVGFAYINFETTGTLDHWQIITCSLASGLASILIFLPHLFDNFLFRVFDPINRKDEELIRKVFFDLKEMRGELDAISVKIDKVPTLVDKIVSDAQKPQDNPALSELSTELAQTRDALESKLARLEELSTQAPLLPEPDPGIAQANDSISKLATALKSLGKQIDSIQSTISELPTEFPEIPTPQPPKMVESSSPPKTTQARSATVDEILSEDAFSPDTPAPSTSTTNPSDEEAEKDTPIDSEPDPVEETEEPEEIIEESPTEPEEEPDPSESAEMEETDSEEEITAEPDSTPETQPEEEEESPQVEETETPEDTRGFTRGSNRGKRRIRRTGYY